MGEKGDSEPKPEKATGSGIGSFADLGLSLFDRAIAKPYNATLGLVAPEIDLSGSYDHASLAAKTGELGGAVLDMVGLSKLSGWGVGRGLGWSAERGFFSASLAESSMLSSTLSLGTAGALYGGVFTPGSGTDRLKNAGVDLATFASMGASSSWLGRFGVLGEIGSRSLMQDMAVGGLSGLPGGVVNAEATSLANGQGFANGQDVASSALYYSAFGILMSGAGHGLTEAVKARSWLTDNSAQSRPQMEQPAKTAADEGPAPSPGTRQFNIPETGNIELGQMMRETPSGDQIALVQQVIASRPEVPMGSWMRLIAKGDMAQFLRASDQMYPDTALENAGYLIGARNLRPPTPDSPPIDFAAWERALKVVKRENMRALAQA